MHAFSGIDRLAALEGDFIMSASEVQPALRVLRKTGIRTVALHNDHELCVIDAKNYSLRQPIALPKSLGVFKLESSRPRIYINAKNDGVIAIDTEADKIIGRFSVAPSGANAAIAIDEPSNRLFIGCRRNPALVVMDSDSGKVVASVPIPGAVDDLSFDTGRKLIFASCGEGAISVIRQHDADHYESLGTVTTVSLARTSVFDQECGRLYLAVPRTPDRPAQQNPELWVYQVLH